MSLTKVGLFGGSFDPIHIGHLRLAFEADQQLQCDQFFFLPSRQPPDRLAPQVSGTERLTLIQAALTDCQQLHWQISDYELTSQNISYTYYTLMHWRKLMPNASICFLIGADRAASLPSWHAAHHLLSLAHIIICSRAGYPWQPQNILASWWQQYGTLEIEQIALRPSGCLFKLDIPELAISSSLIREHCANKQSIRYLVPSTVERLIHEKKYYQS